MARSAIPTVRFAIRVFGIRIRILRFPVPEILALVKFGVA
jgi:hypothetical protein